MPVSLEQIEDIGEHLDEAREALRAGESLTAEAAKDAHPGEERRLFMRAVSTISRSFETLIKATDLIEEAEYLEID